MDEEINDTTWRNHCDRRRQSGGAAAPARVWVSPIERKGCNGAEQLLQPSSLEQFTEPLKRLGRINSRESGKKKLRRGVGKRYRDDVVLLPRLYTLVLFCVWTWSVRETAGRRQESGKSGISATNN